MMVRKKTVLGIGLVIAGIGLFLIPLGTDVILALATQLMNGNYWLGDLLVYVITVGMIVIGSLIIWKPNYFYRPLNLVLAILVIVALGFLTWFFGTGHTI